MTLLTSGWYGRRVGGRVRVGRSTLILLVVFVVLGLLYLQTRPDRTQADDPVSTTQAAISMPVQPAASSTARSRSA